MEITPFNSVRSPALAQVAPPIQAPTGVNSDDFSDPGAQLKQAPVPQDFSNVSGEAQEVEGAQTGALQATGSVASGDPVQQLIEQLKTDLAVVQSVGQSQGSEQGAGADLGSARAKLEETYQQVSDQGQLSRVDSLTRQGAEQTLGISTTSVAQANTAAGTQVSGTGGAFSLGVLDGLNSLLGSQASA